MTGSYYRLPTEAEWKRAARGVPRQCCSHGVMIRHIRVPSTKIDRKPALSLSGNHSRMVTAYSRCARTCMSGVVTGSTPATMRSHLRGIHKDRKKAREKRRAEDPGDTTSRSHDVRRVPESRWNSDTLIMAFGLSAVGHAEGCAEAFWFVIAYCLSEPIAQKSLETLPIVKAHSGVV